MKNNPHYVLAFELAVKIGDEIDIDMRRRLVGQWSAAMAAYLATTGAARAAHV